MENVFFVKNNMTPKALSREIKKLFCFHPRLLCEENNVYGMGASERIIYISPWSQFGIKEIEYKCTKCGKLFWYTRGDMWEQKYQERFINLLTKENK